MNEGFVPILQVQSGDVILESITIMRFLAEITGDEKYAVEFKDRINPVQLIPKDAL